MTLNIMVLHWGSTGAGPLFTLRLAQELSIRNGLNVVCSYSSDADIAEDFKRLSIPLLPIRTWKGPLGVPGAILRMPLIVLRLRRFMRKQRIQVVIVGMDQVLQAPLAWTFRSHGAAYLHFLHDGRLHLGERSRFHDLLRTAHLKPASAVMVLSSAVAEVAQKEWGFAAHRIFKTSLPALLLDDAVGPKARCLDTSRPVRVGMFGRAVAYKGYDLAVSACSEVVSLGGNVELLLVGSGVSAFLEQTSSPKPWLKVDDRWLPAVELIDIIRSFDVVLVPYKEASQSVVLMESTALGIPCIVTPVGALPEQAAATGGALVSSQVSASSISHSLLELIREPDTYARLSAAGIRNTRSTLGWTAVGDEVEHAIAALVKPIR